MEQIIIEVWGDFACFSRPDAKVERLTYALPTPSAARGIFSAIYSKPEEFYWQIDRIEILKPLQYISFKRNEVKKTQKNAIFIEDGDVRTQRQTVALQDVRYRIAATIVKQPTAMVKERALHEQAMNRIRKGKCFYQPSLGLREFACYFAESDGKARPIDLNLDLGYMVYDIFDLHKFAVTTKAEPFVSLFHAQIKGGVLEVPPFDSPLVLKPGGDDNAE